MSIAPAPTSPWLRAPLLGLLRLSLRSGAAELLLATLLVTLLALALPILLMQLYDRILPNAATGTLAVLAAGVGAALALETALRLARADALSRLGARAELELHRAALDRLLHARPEALRAHGDGWHSERLHAIAGLREAWSGPALQALLDLPFAGLYLLALWAVAGPLAAAPAALLAATLAAGALCGRRVRRRARALAKVEERRLNFLFDTLHGLPTLKLLGAESLMERRHDRLQGEAARRRRRLADASAATQDAGLLLAALATILTAAWGGSMVAAGELTVGGLGASVMLAARSMQPVVGGAALWSRLQGAGEQADRVRELDALPRDARPDLPPLIVAEGRVALESVACGRLAGGGWLFEDMSLDVAPGELVGIIGANGSGRSRLLQLVAGEARPDAGRVLIDGRDLGRVDVSGARRRLALVPQEPFVVRGSLLDNLTLFDPDLEPEALRWAGRLGLDAVAGGLPQGWRTPVGVGGAPLPRGAVQRLGLARALAAGPRILLLDDVTAHLDAAGDAALCAALEDLRGRVTVVMTSHRRAVLARMDRRLVIADGRLEPWE